MELKGRLLASSFFGPASIFIGHGSTTLPKRSTHPRVEVSSSQANLSASTEAHRQKPGYWKALVENWEKLKQDTPRQPDWAHAERSQDEGEKTTDSEPRKWSKRKPQLEERYEWK
ncbi:uncharacterized protein RHO25_013186 [Cercospora beticola]|uniref:Uncharacterized protein n=1 Tax=Cercospora beticola TaxID=122368 RepID=A0ABZ0PAF3_CERBT|nr:hypothetical protein RHO25_013186 [Cercospora beticola]